MNYTMSVDEEKVEALVHTSGLHYSDFDSKSMTFNIISFAKFSQYTVVGANKSIIYEVLCVRGVLEENPHYLAATISVYHLKLHTLR